MAELKDPGKMTPEEARTQVMLIKRLIAAKTAKDSLADFVKFMMPDPNFPNDMTKTLYDFQPHHRVIIEALENIESGKNLRMLLSVPPQHGKLCAHDTLVLTTNGWKTHGSLIAGDKVFGSDGLPTEIVALSDEATCDMEVEFTDGEVIQCHERHEWAVHVNDAHDREVKTLETGEMFSRGVWVGESGKRGGRARFSVDWVTIIGCEADLPIDPYSLGAWLGDGKSSASELCFAHADSAVADRVAASYPKTNEWTHKITGVGYAYFGGGLRVALRQLGLLNNKHIPDVYFVSSIAQRQSLLAGLMDTDGYVHHRTRRACFSSCNRTLVDDVATLVRTLGMRATIAEFDPIMSSSGIQGRKSVYQVTFSPTVDIPCLLERKRIDAQTVKYRTRGIRAIRRCAPKPGRCIQVAAPDGIYLVGRGLVPTHNSLLASIMFPAWAIGRKPWRKFIITTYSDDFSQQFGAKVRAILQSPQYAQVFPKFRLRPGSKSKSELVTLEGGHLVFSGLRGRVTGVAADVVLADDLLKGRVESNSLTIRDQVWEFLWSVAYARLNASGAMIGIGTRWNEDDHIGRLTDKSSSYYDPEEAKKWTYINLPAIIEDAALAKALDRKPGEVLWPGRYSLEHFETVKKMDEYTFNALYMGRPTPPEGAFFKHWQLKTYASTMELPKGMRMYGSCDLAVSPDRNADSSVVINWGLDEHDVLWCLPDVYWDKKTSDETVEKLIEFGRQYDWMTLFGEKGQITRSVGPFLSKRMMEEGMFFAVEDFANIAKDQAAVSFRGRCAEGKVRFPAFAPWWPRAKEQILKFTGKDDPSDDFVDACSRIGQGLQMQVRGVGAGKKKSNVIPIAGTTAWMFAQYSHRQATEKKVASLKGM